MASNFDEFMFMAIKQSKSIEDILENFFSFLRRHTDFCHTMLSMDDIRKFNLDPSVNTKGFRQNQMLNLVTRIIEDNLLQYRKAHQPYLLDPKYLSEFKSTSTANLKGPSNFKSVDKSKDSTITPNKNVEESKSDSDCSSSGILHKKDDSGSQKGCSEPLNSSSLDYTINPWNGAITKKYAWTQSFKELTVEILSSERLSSKDVSVLMTKSRLTVKMLDQVLVDGELCRPINNYDSVWSIEDGRRILINIEKAEEYWWDCVVKGDETIDTQQIESVKRLDEFSESEQNAILKMMKDHRSKNNMYL